MWPFGDSTCLVDSSRRTAAIALLSLTWALRRNRFSIAPSVSGSVHAGGDSDPAWVREGRVRRKRQRVRFGPRSRRAPQMDRIVSVCSAAMKLK